MRLPISILGSTALCLLASTSFANELEWFDGPFSNAVGQARQNDQWVMVYFWRDGSEYCSQLWQETLTRPEAAAALDDHLLVSAAHGDGRTAALYERFGVQTLPSLVFVSPEGQVEDGIFGFIDVNGFVGEVERIESGVQTVSGLRGELAEKEEGSEDELGLRLVLAQKLSELGQGEEGERLVASVRESDPNGRTRPGNRLLLDELLREIAEEGGGDEHFADWDLDPLYRRARRAKDAARYDTWNRIANLEIQREDKAAGLEAFQSAFEHTPADERAGWCKDVAWWMMESLDYAETPRRDKRFAMEIALAGIEAIEEQLERARAESGEGETDSSASYQIAEHVFTAAMACRWNDEVRRSEELCMQSIELAPDVESYAQRLDMWRNPEAYEEAHHDEGHGEG